MTDGEEARCAQLLAEAGTLFDGLWDEEAGMCRTPEHPAVHGARATLSYASVLLHRADAMSIARAETAIRRTLELQERHEDDAHYGNVRWTAEQKVVIDLNGVEFALEALVELLRAHEAKLDAALARETRDTIALGLREIDRLDVHPSYTNIYLSDVSNRILGGELLGDEATAAQGIDRLDAWAAYTDASGAPHEFNSPTYLAVDIARMAAVAEYASQPEVRLKARLAEERLWMHVATHYHPGLAQLAGPHSRAYFDGWTGAGGYLKLMLWRLLGDPALRRETPYVVQGREEAFDSIATAVLHCPPMALDLLRSKRYPYAVRERPDVIGDLDTTTYLDAAFTLGSASKPFAVGERQETWPQPDGLLLQFSRDEAPGYGTLFSRYQVDAEPAENAAALPEYIQEEGQFAMAQDRGRAIVAYAPRPRLRVARRYAFHVRLLGASDKTHVRAGGRPVDAYPVEVAEGEAVVMGEGGVYIALIPLPSTDMGRGARMRLDRCGDMLTLEVENYRGPGKTFWEYRSHSGPFFRGNVRSAFLLEAAPRGDFPDLAAFERHIAGSRIADVTSDDLAREITWSCDDGVLSLRYSLVDMRVISRSRDGEPLPMPPSRAGALDGRGIQSVLAHAGVATLGQVRVVGGGPTQIIADADHGRYVAVRASGAPRPLLFETPDACVECDAFGIGRIAIGETQGAICVEAADACSPLTFTGGAGLRLLVNGSDVTAQMRDDGEGGRVFAGMDEAAR